MENRPSSEYVLRQGSEADKRLSLLAEAKSESTWNFLSELDLAPGMRCLDIGCGNGTVTMMLARATSPGGRVTGIKLDEGCLDSARSNAESAGLEVEYRRCAVEEIRGDGDCDFVFSGFLLTHLQDPGAALHTLRNTLKPGGVIATEDIQFSGNRPS